jgi:hypothetical protein
MGINIFKSMSFGQLFADENISSLQNRYLAAKERVSTDWYSLMKHRINVFLPLSRIFTSCSNR